MKVSEIYPELFHYTTAAGLTGILSSDSLWATHGAFLNDAEEMTHFFDERLPRIAEEEIHRVVSELEKEGRLSTEEVEKYGGSPKFISDEARANVEILRKVTLNFNDPYIFSLSAPQDDYARKSGLLSQWRGYGSDGGYAIVLDTRGVELLLTSEDQQHYYNVLLLREVFYHGIDPALQPSAADDVKKDEELVCQAIRSLSLEQNIGETPSNPYNAISALSCSCKHRGFWEEKEIRIVAIPPKKTYEQEARRLGETRRRREAKAFIKNGVSIPYLDLFSSQSDSTDRMRLPIKQVIIGPHKDREKRRQAVEMLLDSNGYDVPVTCSDIPYIGR